jgi:hypothetical protein
MCVDRPGLGGRMLPFARRRPDRVLTEERKFARVRTVGLSIRSRGAELTFYPELNLNFYPELSGPPRCQLLSAPRQCWLLPALDAPPMRGFHPKLPADATDGNDPRPCPHCGGRMIIIETFERGSMPRHRPKGPTIAIRIDTSRRRPPRDHAKSFVPLAGSRPATTALAQISKCRINSYNNLRCSRHTANRS